MFNSQTTFALAAANSQTNTAFNQQHLPPIPPIPDRAYFKAVEQKLLDVAKSIPSHRGGGNNGHKQILAGNDIAYYDRITNNAPVFHVPNHPGDNPNIPPNATQHQIIEANRVWHQQINEYTTYQKTESDLKQLIMDTFPEEWYFDLHHDTLGYSNISCAEIWSCIRTALNTVTREDLEANATLLRSPHNLNTTVKATCMHKKRCQTFALDTADPIPDARLITETLGAFRETKDKHFLDAIKTFEKRQEADQTWDNLKTDLLEGEKLRNKDLNINPTSSHAGFLATNKTPEESTPPPATPPPLIVLFGNTQFGYCHTHGLCRNPKHNSKTCRSPAAGHQKEATLKNMMGGNNQIQRLRNERAISRE